MDDYTENFINKSSPLLRRTVVKAIDFDTQFQIQGRGMKIGKPSFGDLIQVSGTAAAVGTVSANNRVVFTSDIAPGTGFAGRIIAGWCSQEIYEGLAVNGSNLIFPAPGGSITTDRWRFSSGYVQLGGSEINHRFQVMVHNNTAGNLPVYGVAKWKYVINGGGTKA